jgi:hypothetical protein
MSDNNLLTEFVFKTLSFARRNAPTLLTAAAVIGVGTTVGLAISATPQAVMAIDELRYKRGQDGENDEDMPDPVTKVEIVKLVWKFYIPTAVMFGTTVTCIIGANMIHLDRQAALLALYGITDVAFKEYRAKVLELSGPKKEDQVRAAIASDRFTRNPPAAGNIIRTGKGTSLCYDKLSGRYFLSDVATLRNVQNQFNRALMTQMFMSLNELYSEMGLEGIELGKHIGWQIEQGLLDFRFDARLIPETNEPCVVVDHYLEPALDEYLA